LPAFFNKTMSQFNSFLLTIAAYSPYKVNLLADKYGYPRPKDVESRIGFLQVFAEDLGDNALYELALIHPDKEIIVAADNEKKISIRQNNFDGSVVEEKTQQAPLPKTEVSHISYIDTTDRRRIAILIIIGIILFITLRSE